MVHFAVWLDDSLESLQVLPITPEEVKSELENMGADFSEWNGTHDYFFKFNLSEASYGPPRRVALLESIWGKENLSKISELGTGSQMLLYYLTGYAGGGLNWEEFELLLMSSLLNHGRNEEYLFRVKFFAVNRVAGIDLAFPPEAIDPSIGFAWRKMISPETVS